MNTTADGRIVPERSYDRNNYPSTTSPPAHDRSFSLTSTHRKPVPEDRSYTLSSAERNYPATRTPSSNLQQRRIEDGRSMTMSGRMGGGNGGSPPMDFSRPMQPRQQIPPGSPRRATTKFSIFPIRNSSTHWS